MIKVTTLFLCVAMFSIVIPQSGFASGKQFRPPMFKLCKVNPDHKKCKKGDKKGESEKDESEKDKK